MIGFSPFFFKLRKELFY